MVRGSQVWDEEDPSEVSLQPSLLCPSTLHHVSLTDITNQWSFTCLSTAWEVCLDAYISSLVIFVGPPVMVTANGSPLTYYSSHSTLPYIYVSQFTFNSRLQYHLMRLIWHSRPFTMSVWHIGCEPALEPTLIILLLPSCADSGDSEILISPVITIFYELFHYQSYPPHTHTHQLYSCSLECFWVLHFHIPYPWSSIQIILSG